MRWSAALRGFALLLGGLALGCDDAPRELWEEFPYEMALSVQRGVARGACSDDGDCSAGAVCPAGYGYCVTPCRSDAECLAPSRCLLDRLDVDFCGCAAPECADMRRF